MFVSHSPQYLHFYACPRCLPARRWRRFAGRFGARMVRRSRQPRLRMWMAIGSPPLPPMARLLLDQPPAQIEVSATHYVTAVVTIAQGEAVNVVLRQPLETVTVTAYRSALGSSDSPASTRVLDQRQLQQAAVPALDGKLREVPGFELFRRSSSLVANPTTEGVSLRGLGSTAASRSLVVLDDIPLNDPLAAGSTGKSCRSWRYSRLKLCAEARRTCMDPARSAASSASSRCGRRAPGSQIVTSGGSESTLDDGRSLTLKRGAWSGLASGGLIATDGYTLIAPDQRGPIDQPSNVHAQNGLAEIERSLPGSGRIFLRGNVLNEQRHNGTPSTWNATRLWRGGRRCGLARFRDAFLRRQRALPADLFQRWCEPRL